MNYNIYSFLSGIIIGTCMILPGISGSVIAIMLGIYENAITLINNKEVSIFNKIKILTPLFIGLLFGIFLFGKILLIFYNNYSYQMMYIFIGLIIGSIPMLINELKTKKENINIIYFLLSLSISLFLSFCHKFLFINIHNELSTINLFIGGILYITGKIIPGISSSFFLMILGLYDYLLKIITNPFSITTNKIITLIPFFIGCIIGLLFILKTINYLLKNYFSKTYSCIIGFIIGSIFAIFPGFQFSIKCASSIIFMITSFNLVYKLSKK